MSKVPNPTRHERAGNLPQMLAIALCVGLAVASRTRGRRRESGEQSQRDDRHRALVAYLHEHLTGADAAIGVVERLRQTQSAERPLFERLYDDFRADHQVVQALLTRLGESPRSAKRLVGQASGAVLKRLGGGSAGDLSLFRTLEALSIGVQGKRCMWRALGTVRPALPLPGTWSFADLDAAAVRQWEAIEERRLLLAPRTFGVHRSVRKVTE
jgi:hypothetical protein